ncbi:hypothetical protein TrCOL_g2329 [Triparma columacea]|nr:hypothetical protein TrCOL_g2329 [Triparma columacea]
MFRGSLKKRPQSAAALPNAISKMEIRDMFMKKEAQREVRHHTALFGPELARLEREIEQEARRAAEEGEGKDDIDTVRGIRRTRGTRGRGEMIFHKNVGVTGNNIGALRNHGTRSRGVSIGHPEADVDEEGEKSAWERVERERMDEFDRSMRALTKGPRVKVGEEKVVGVPLSFNEKKKPGFMRSKGADDYFDEESTVEYEETESYKERVQGLCVVDQMRKAHDINEKRKMMIERDGKVAYRQSFRDKMKDAHAVHRYRESMQNEKSKFESLGLLCETRLKECIAHTSLVEELPDEYRMAVVCDILLKLTPVFGRYDALITVLVKEIMRGVYEDFDEVYEGEETEIDVLINLGRPYFHSLRKLKDEHTLAVHMLENMKTKTGYMETSLAKGQKAITSVLRLWNNDTLEQVFRAWKKCLTEKSVSRHYTEIMFKKARLKIWFHGWRFRILRKLAKGVSDGGDKKTTRAMVKMIKLCRRYVDEGEDSGKLKRSMVSTFKDMQTGGIHGFDLVEKKEDKEEESEYEKGGGIEEEGGEGEEKGAFEEVEEVQTEHIHRQHGENMMQKKKRIRQNFKYHVDNARKQRAEKHVYGMMHKENSASHMIIGIHQQYKSSTSMAWAYMFMQTILADNASLEKKIKELQFMVSELKEKVERKDYLDIEEETINRFKDAKSGVEHFIDFVLEKDQMMTIHEDPSMELLKAAATRTNRDPLNKNLWGKNGQ